jgi:hypothetical protein
MKRIAVFLAVTFGATWGLWIAAGILTGAYGDGNINSTMGGFVAIGMFCPLLGTLVTNAISPKNSASISAFRRVFARISDSMCWRGSCPRL